VLYAILKPLVVVLMRLLFRVEARGVDHVPAEGPVLLVANHSSNLDSPLVGGLVPRPVSFMAKAELFQVPGFGALISRLNARPVRREGADAGALRAALFAERHPERVRRLALDAFVWTGQGSPTLADRRKRLPEFQARNRRPIDRAFVRSIFTRDHPGTADDEVIEAFADAILALDDSVPTGTYVDMFARLPVVDPTRILAPTLIMRGQYDGIASLEDLLEFFTRLPNPDKQFAIMPGIAHASFHQKNYRLAHHILHAFFSQPAPVYRGA
jgi:pimeloyl-ACP methyl ester carboxylesterase